MLDRDVWRTKPELMNYTAVLYGTVACPSLLQKYILKQQIISILYRSIYIALSFGTVTSRTHARTHTHTHTNTHTHRQDFSHTFFGSLGGKLAGIIHRKKVPPRAAISVETASIRELGLVCLSRLECVGVWASVYVLALGGEGAAWCVCACVRMCVCVCVACVCVCVCLPLTFSLWSWLTL